MDRQSSRVDTRQLARKSRQNLLRIRERNSLEANLFSVQVSRLHRQERRNLEMLQKDLRRIEVDRQRSAKDGLTDDFLTAEAVSQGRLQSSEQRSFGPSRVQSAPPKSPANPRLTSPRRPTSACQFRRFGATSSVCPFFPCTRPLSQTSMFSLDESEEEEEEEEEEDEEEEKESWIASLNMASIRTARKTLTTPMDRARSLRKRMEEWRLFHQQRAPQPRETRYGVEFPMRKIIKTARPSSTM